MGQGAAGQPAVPTQLGDEQPGRQSCFLSRSKPPLAGLEHPLDCSWEGVKYKPGTGAVVSDLVPCPSCCDTPYLRRLVRTLS